MRGLTVAVVLLACFVASTLACSCIKAGISQIYERETHVFKGKIVKRLASKDDMQRLYLVRVQRPFKGCIEGADWVIVRTADNSAACGVNFDVGKTYLITGSHKEACCQDTVPVINANLCGQNELWKPLSKANKNFLKSRQHCCECENSNIGCYCGDGSRLANCLIDPCRSASLSGVECTDTKASCAANYCGGCNAEWFRPDGARACYRGPTCTIDGRTVKSGIAVTVGCQKCRCRDGQVSCKRISGCTGEGTNECTVNADCGEGSYCQKPDGQCDGPGSCAAIPNICTLEFNPQCGCNGQTYPNKCGASAAGVNVATAGECAETVCGSDDQCPKGQFCQFEGFDGQPRTCVAFSSVGQSCEGFTPTPNRCEPGLICQPFIQYEFEPQIADIPGTCCQPLDCRCPPGEQHVVDKDGCKICQCTPAPCQGAEPVLRDSFAIRCGANGQSCPAGSFCDESEEGDFAFCCPGTLPAAGCESNDDCAASEFCQFDFSTQTSKCAKRVPVGGSCGGFRVAPVECAVGLQCQEFIQYEFEPQIADAPGTCCPPLDCLCPPGEQAILDSNGCKTCSCTASPCKGETPVLEGDRFAISCGNGETCPAGSFCDQSREGGFAFCCPESGTAQPDKCSLPAEPGPCRAFFPRFYYNTQSQQCESFVYGGCQGNANNFATIEDCQAACFSPCRQQLAAARQCKADSDCVASVPGSSCGCTRNHVINGQIKVRAYQALLSECGNTLSTCDCPAANGFKCVNNQCTWNYV